MKLHKYSTLMRVSALTAFHCDALDFDAHAAEQLRADRCAHRIGVGEITLVYFVHLRKVAEVRKKNIDLDDIIHCLPSRVHNRFDVLKSQRRLFFKSLWHFARARVEWPLTRDVDRVARDYR